MNKWLVFLGGVVAGFVLACVVAVVFSTEKDADATPETKVEKQESEPEGIEV